MSERDPSLNLDRAELAPAIAIGGLLSVKELWPWYSLILSGKTKSRLPIKDRFLAIPDKGRGEPEETYGLLEENVKQAVERLDEPPVIITHSLSGLYGMRLMLDHPDWAKSFVALAGAQEGKKGETPTTLALRYLLGNPKHSDQLEHDSDTITELKDRVASEWHSELDMHLLSPTFDHLMPLPQGLRLELPDDREPQRKVVGIPTAALRKMPDVPRNTTGLFYNGFPIMCGHEDMPVNLAVISYTRAVRRAAQLKEDGTTPDNNAPRPYEMPLAA